MFEKEKMLLAEHLSLMLKGGIPLNEALETVRNDARSKSFKRTINDVLNKILEGENLNKALAKHPQIFDRFFQSIIRIGEESGTLDENLKYLSLKLRQDDEMNKKIKGAFLYPTIVIALATAIAILMAVFVLPKITEPLKILKIELPLATRILVAAVSFIKTYWLFILIIIFLAVLLIRILQRIKTIRFYLDKVSLSLPLFGKISKNFNLSFFSRTFYILLKSGVPLSTTLEIISETLPNAVYRHHLIKIKEKVETGAKISQSLKDFSDFFPAIFSEMILVGEKAGSLEDSLLYLCEHYEREVDSTLKNFTAVLEPMLIIFIGFFAGFTAIAIISPMYKLIRQLQFR